MKKEEKQNGLGRKLDANDRGNAIFKELYNEDPLEYKVVMSVTPT